MNTEHPIRLYRNLSKEILLFNNYRDSHNITAWVTQHASRKKRIIKYFNGRQE